MAVDKSRFPRDVLDVYARAAQRPGALTAMINWYRAAVRHRTALDIGDGRVDVPTLIVAGVDDDDNGSGAALADAMPQAIFREIPGNHMSAVTKPELGQAIADFLSA